MNNDPNQPGSTPDRPADETPGAPGAPGETPSSGQPTERVTPPDFQPPPAPDPSQFTMPQPQTTIYSPQPGPQAGGPGATPPANSQPVGGTPPSQQPYGGGQAGAPQQGYPAPGQYPPGQPPQGQFTPPGQYQQQGYPPPGQYPPQYPQGNVPPGQPPYPPPGYVQPAQPLPKKGGVPVIAWVIGGLVAALLLICGITAFLAVQTVNTATRSIGDAFGTVGASFGGLTSSLFYNDLNAGDYESARDYLSTELKREYSAARLQEEWERLVDGAGGITVGDYVMIGNDNNLWLQELEGQENGQFYEIQVTVRTVGSDYVITDAKPSLIPEP